MSLDNHFSYYYLELWPFEIFIIMNLLASFPKNVQARDFKLGQLIRDDYSPVLRIDNQQNFKIMKISILFKSFISLFYIIRYIL